MNTDFFFLVLSPKCKSGNFFLTKTSKIAMLPEKTAGLHTFIGRYLFHWVMTRAYVWFAMYVCVDFMQKVHGPLDRSVRTLDRLLRTYEDDADPENDDDVENNENDPLDWVLRTSYRWQPVPTG